MTFEEFEERAEKLGYFTKEKAAEFVKLAQDCGEGITAYTEPQGPYSESLLYGIEPSGEISVIDCVHRCVYDDGDFCGYCGAVRPYSAAYCEIYGCDPKGD